ncbi:MAG: phosphate ABC transporter permease PstA [Acidimicrobiaceae bacterium]|nr:phosphate ABC transporter permease PstA [Acidimicrobiaceae bacterium]
MAWSLSYLTLLLVITPAVLIVGHVVLQALPHFQFSVLTSNTTGLGGGLKNEIAGTLVIVLGVLVIAGGLGILSGIYLSNYAKNKFGNFLRSSSEVLAGIPSIVFGYVGYIALVVHFHWGFSLGAGLITLSLMVVPYVSKTTEVALRQVPSGYSEGGEALGLSEGYILRRITLKSALPGVVTGIIVAVAIATGETAPLLYTAGYSQNLPKLAVTHSPLGYLTYAVWTFYNQPSKAAVQLSYDAAFLLIVGVVLLIVISRIVVSASQKHSENR